MLLQKTTTKEGDIVSFKSTAGEEVLGKLVKSDETTITLAKPILVQLQMMQSGGAAISFAPFSLARDDASDFTFYKSAMLTTAEAARDDIRANYIKATTGLDVPTSAQASAILRP